MARHDGRMELLAPAGGPSQLDAAIRFGADAVYLAGPDFGMRAHAANFGLDELGYAVRAAHAADVDVHLTCNVMMMQDDLRTLPSYLEAVDAAGVDALIIGDLGAFSLAREHAPHCELHISTQASVSNAESARMWHSLGAKRIVCAREMTLSDIASMREQVPDDLEIEAFAHGAQCMAVSGRCLMSSYLAERSGNRGDCTQPCRWRYSLVEETRPGQLMDVVEDDRGSLIMNAMDLCMIEHLDEMAEAGIDSIKVEGRNKKAFYVATVVGAYRRALDGGDPDELRGELLDISHRPYSTGFFFGEPKQAIDYDGYEQETLHIADVISSEQLDDGSYELLVRCRNRMEPGDQLEILSPHAAVRGIEVGSIQHMGVLHPPSEDARRSDSATVLDGSCIDRSHAIGRVDVANRTSDVYAIRSAFPVSPGSFLRKRAFRRSSRS